LVDAAALLKHHTAVARHRNATMLPPKILEKKNERMIAKYSS
jgi:hypothetical protein